MLADSASDPWIVSFGLQVVRFQIRANLNKQPIFKVGIFRQISIIDFFRDRYFYNTIGATDRQTISLAEQIIAMGNRSGSHCCFLRGRKSIGISVP